MIFVEIRLNTKKQYVSIKTISDNHKGVIARKFSYHADNRFSEVMRNLKEMYGNCRISALGKKRNSEDEIFLATIEKI